MAVPPNMPWTVDPHPRKKMRSIKRPRKDWTLDRHCHHSVTHWQPDFAKVIIIIIAAFLLAPQQSALIFNIIFLLSCSLQRFNRRGGVLQVLQVLANDFSNWATSQQLTRPGLPRRRGSASNGQIVIVLRNNRLIILILGPLAVPVAPMGRRKASCFSASASPPRIS